MTEVRDELVETESAFSRFGSQVVDVMTRVGSVVADVIGAVASDLFEVSRGALKAVGQDFLEMAIYGATAGAAVTATGSYFAGFWTTMRVGLSVASWFVPWLKVATISLAALSIGTRAYAAADEYLNGALTESLSHTEASSAGWEKLKGELGNTASVLGTVGDGFGSMGAQLVQAAVDVSGISYALETVDKVQGIALSGVAKGVELVNKGLQSGIDAYADYRSEAGASAAELRRMAAATEEVIAKQTAQADIFRQVRAMQEGAAAEAAHRAELARIASIETQDGINAEITALQQRTQQEVVSGKTTEESLKKTGALFAALENQRVAIDSGKMAKKGQKSDTDNAIERARKDLDSLTLGRSEAEIAALKASGATDEEVESLRALHAEIERLNTAKEIKKNLDAELANIAKEQEQQDKQFSERMADLADDIDKITGAATDADIAVRKMLRDGFSQEQADEIGRMTAELDKLRKEEKDAKDKKTGGKSLAAAAEFGSSAALSIIANASNTRDPVEKNTDKIAKEAVKQTGHLQKIATEVGDFQNVSVLELPA